MSNATKVVLNAVFIVANVHQALVNAEPFWRALGITAVLLCYEGYWRAANARD
jgi:hypothetical protein